LWNPPARVWCNKTLLFSSTLGYHPFYTINSTPRRFYCTFLRFTSFREKKVTRSSPGGDGVIRIWTKRIFIAARWGFVDGVKGGRGKNFLRVRHYRRLNKCLFILLPQPSFYYEFHFFFLSVQTIYALNKK
jgi:hypothetical protein